MRATVIGFHVNRRVGNLKRLLGTRRVRERQRDPELGIDEVNPSFKHSLPVERYSIRHSHAYPRVNTKLQSHSCMFLSPADP